VPPPPRDGKPHGRPPVDPSGFLSIETIRKRRTTLQSFFARMNKGQGRNPAKEAELPKRLPEGDARSLDFLTIERVVAAMPTAQHGARSLAKIRARVIAYTGLPPKMLMQVQEPHLSLVAGTLRVMKRQKGTGVGECTIHLNEEALAAFRDFHAADAYGGFHVETVNIAFKRAAKRAGLDPRAVHLYDLRHSYLTEMYRITRDHATVARLGLHAPGSRTTARYTSGAHAEVDAAAVDAFSAALARRRREALKPARKVSVDAVPAKTRRRA
jgi:integrase